MPKKGAQYRITSLIFSLVAVSAASLAGVVYFSQGNGAAPAAAKPAVTAHPSPVKATPTNSVSATATGEPSPTPKATASAVPSLAPTISSTPATMQPTVARTASPKPTPSPKATAAPTKKPAPTATAKKEPAKLAEKTMTIGTLISRMADRPFDAYGSIGVVKRGAVAYYLWAQELYVVDGKGTRRILGNVDCHWMYVDEGMNLWFGIEGGSGIAANRVQQWQCAYRYDHVKGEFALMRQETQQVRFLDGQGFAMVGPYYLYLNGNVLMACHTATGVELRIDTVCAEAEIRVVQKDKAVYYQNAKRDYVLLSNLGEANQGKTALDLAKFPGGMFQLGAYAMDGSGVLYRFQRTGYAKVTNSGGIPAGASLSEMPPAASDGGIGFPGDGVVTLDFFDVRTNSWQRTGTPSQEGSFCQATIDGRYWFVGWKPAVLYQIYQGKLAKYDLSGAMQSCAWSGMAGEMIFLSEFDFYSNFTHVFLSGKQELYEITFPPLPGDPLDN